MAHRGHFTRRGIPPSEAERLRIAGQLAATGIACDSLAGKLAMADPVPPIEYERTAEALRIAADVLDAMGRRSATPGGHLALTPQAT